MDYSKDYQIFFSFIPYSYKILIASIIILCGIKWRRRIQEYLNERSAMIKLADKLPGPPGLPLLGNALEFLDAENHVVILNRLSRRSEALTYKLWIGPLLNVIVTDPQDLEILMTSPKAAKKNYIYDLMKRIVERGLIKSYGEIYRSHKKLLVKLVNDGTWLETAIEKANYHSRILVKRFEKKINHPQFDINDYMQYCLGDIIFDTIYGQPERTQSGDTSEFFELAAQATDILASRFFRPWYWNDFIFRRTKIGKKWEQLARRVLELIASIIDNKWENIGKHSINGDDKFMAIFDRMMQSANQTGTWSNKDLLDEYIVLWIGSHDTLATVTVSTILMLAMHPEVQERAREEIKTVVGDGDINETNGIDLKYLEMVIKETLRLLPIGPVIGREPTDELKLASCTVPKGCSLIIPIYVINRNPRFWEEPDKFDPERFSPENSKNRHPYAYIPFSGGLRGCPGQKFGMICAKVVVAQVLRSYRLETTQKIESLSRIKADIVTKCRDGYPVAFKRI